MALLFGLSDRGLLRPVFAADITVFDLSYINTLEPEYAQDLPGNEPRMIQRAASVEAIERLTAEGLTGLVP